MRRKRRNKVKPEFIDSLKAGFYIRFFLRLIIRNINSIIKHKAILGDVVLSHKKQKSKKGIAIAIVLLAVSACVIAAIAVKQNIILQTTKKA